MNYELYNQRMGAVIKQKLFFLDKIDFDVLIDFGCADGTVIFELANIMPDKQFIGYDIDAEMIKLAEEKCIMLRNTHFSTEMPSRSLHPMKVAILMSSVLHEVLTFQDEDYLQMILRSINPNYVIIRDMYSNGVDLDMDTRKQIYYKIMEDKDERYPNSVFTEEQIASWDTYDYVEYMLKRRYLKGHNADRERKENYMSLAKLLYKKEYIFGTALYRKDYCPKFFRDLLSKDLDIDWYYSTHTERIYKYK